MIDLRDLVETWAFKALKRSHCLSGREKRNNVVFDINWGLMTLSTEEEDWTINKQPSSIQALYSGVYENPTNSDTQQKIKLDKETEALFKLDITSGQTDQFPKPLLINLPEDITSATPVFGRTLLLDLNSQTFQTTPKIKWAVDSQVHNPAHSSTRAHVQVKEDVFKGTFSCKARLGGQVVVTAYKRSKPYRPFTVDNDVAEVLKNRPGLKQDPDSKTIAWGVSGNCVIRFGVEHEVKLS